jgi:hypothetical protein
MACKRAKWRLYDIFPIFRFDIDSQLISGTRHVKFRIYADGGHRPTQALHITCYFKVNNYEYGKDAKL